MPKLSAMAVTSIYADANRGASFLDDADEDWYWKVNLDTLDMESANNCILGQLYGDYIVAIHDIAHRHRLKDYFAWAVWHGFCVHSMNPLLDNQMWNTLHDAWVGEVTLRRNRDQKKQSDSYVESDDIVLVKLPQPVA